MALVILPFDFFSEIPRNLSVKSISFAETHRQLKLNTTQKIKTSSNPFQKGNGILAGEAPFAPARLPNGTIAANLRLDLMLDGTKVQETTTDSNGSWKFEHLQQGKFYDIIVRHPVLESIISTKREPGPMPVILDSSGPLYENSTHVTQRLVFSGGFGPYTIQELSSSPFVQFTVNEKSIRVVIEKDTIERNYIIRVTPDLGDYDEFTITAPPL